MRNAHCNGCRWLGLSWPTLDPLSRLRLAFALLPRPEPSNATEPKRCSVARRSGLLPQPHAPPPHCPQQRPGGQLALGISPQSAPLRASAAGQFLRTS